jgi:hypothetical protein
MTSDADPDPAFNFTSVADPDLTFLVKARIRIQGFDDQNLKKIIAEKIFNHKLQFTSP